MGEIIRSGSKVEIEERVADLSSRADVKKWIKRFEALAKAMPKDVWVYVASGSPTLMAYGPNGEMYESGGGGGVDQRAVISMGRIGGSWDGGDW